MHYVDDSLFLMSPIQPRSWVLCPWAETIGENKTASEEQTFVLLSDAWGNQENICENSRVFLTYFVAWEAKPVFVTAT